MEQTKKFHLNKQQVIVLIVIIALTICAWIYTAVNASSSGMDGMSMDMTGAADPEMDAQMAERLAAAAYSPTMPPFSMFVPMWIVMCIGMMLPTAVPMIFAFDTISKRRRAQGFGNSPTYLFILGYVLLWALFGVVCWLVGEGIIALIGGYFTSWTHTLIGVAVIFLIAGVYQLSPLKDACMRGCQHPLAFVLHNWKAGGSGALLMGMKHGMECIGCCWALMVVLFPLGMMNLFWMGLFTLIMFFEKNAKFGTLLSKIVGWLLIVAGAILCIMGIVLLAL